MKGIFRIAFVVAAALVFKFSSPIVAQEIKQEKCPVMGFKPSEKFYVDYKGKRIFFCCASCPDQFKKDPDKYMKKLEEDDVYLEDAPTDPGQ
jgi:YHS domain-containing protein